MTNILKPMTEPFPADVSAVLEKYPTVDGYLLKLFRTFANSLRFLAKGVPNLLDGDSPLSMRQREIVILRTTANNKCEYEWGVHVTVFSAPAKLTKEQVAATYLHDDRAPCWTPEEALLIKVIDELCAAGTVSDAILPQFQRGWTLEQQLEILALAGTYHTVSFVANTARVELEDFGARFPD